MAKGVWSPRNWNTAPTGGGPSSLKFDHHSGYRAPLFIVSDHQAMLQRRVSQAGCTDNPCGEHGAPGLDASGVSGGSRWEQWSLQTRPLLAPLRAKTRRFTSQYYLKQSCVRSPKAWTCRPWAPGSRPSMVPSIKQHSSESWRNRTTPWTFPAPHIMATAEPRSGTEWKPKKCYEKCFPLSQNGATNIYLTNISVHLLLYLQLLTIMFTHCTKLVVVQRETQFDLSLKWSAHQWFLDETEVSSELLVTKTISSIHKLIYSKLQTWEKTLSVIFFFLILRSLHNRSQFAKQYFTILLYFGKKPNIVNH